MIKFRCRMRDLAKDEDGAEVMEYAITIALVGALIVVLAVIIGIVVKHLETAQSTLESLPLTPGAPQNGVPAPTGGAT